MQVTGKALVLDEIINYVQSLQNQVEVIDTLGKYINKLRHMLRLESCN